MGVYGRSGYDYFIDYHSDPTPALTAAPTGARAIPQGGRVAMVKDRP